MLRKKTLLVFVLFFLIGYFLTTSFSLAKIADECNNPSSLSLDAAVACQKEVEKELESLKNAIKPNELLLKQLKSDIANILDRTLQIEQDLNEKEEMLQRGKTKITAQRKILDSKIREYYKKQTETGVLLAIFGKKQVFGDAVRKIFYQKKTAENDKKNITEIALFIKNVETTKKELLNEKTKLISLQENLNNQTKELEKILAGATSYQTQLQSTAARLSARQQELIAQRIGSLHLPTSLGGGPLICSDDREIDPGFRPAFAFFTYGIPHRVGLNQYGARGRAQNGQGVEDILRAYFPNTEIKKDFSTDITIQISGNNEFGESFDRSWNIEEYLKHLYEMPADWPSEALKAQAVAARSFALAYTNNGSSPICATQECQVVKLDENSDNWKAAVEATRGWVLVSGGNPVSAWFASTAGGYTWGSGDVWCKDGTYSGACPNKPWTGRFHDFAGDVSSFADLTSKAYDRESPCFYSAQGWRSEYGKSAWLKSEEVAKIVNALLLAKTQGSAPDGIESWSADKIKEELKNKKGNPFNSITEVSVSADFGTGKVNNLTVSGDAGSQTFDGLEFRNIFNLVAPANIAIVGPLFNIEKK